MLPSEMNILLWYLIVGAVCSLITSALAFFVINNMPVVQLYTVVEFIFVVLFYGSVSGKRGLGRYIPWLSPFFIFITVINLLLYQDIYTYNTNTKSAAALIVILLSVRLFKTMLDDVSPNVESRWPVALVNSGFLLYFSSSFVLFSIYNLIVGNRGYIRVMLMIHASSLILLYLLMSVAFWKLKK